MTLRLDYTALRISGLFMLLVIIFACVTANYYLSRTDIIDVIQEEHRNEPVKQLGNGAVLSGCCLSSLVQS